MECSTAPALPADAIRTGEAIALLAGKPLMQNSRAYVRHQGRLVRAAEQGRLTEYKLGPGRPRNWSQAEVLALRDSLAADGFTHKPPSGYHGRTVKTIVKHAEREGLISLANAATLAGVKIPAARRWTAQGRFGACKIAGLWFFEKAQVAAYRRRAPRQPSQTAPCALCRDPVTLKASRMREVQAIAAAAGSDELLIFCPECWATPEGRQLAHSRRVWRTGYESPGRAAGIKRQWAEGKRDREAHSERNRQAFRSPKTAAGRIEKSTLARHGHGISPGRKAELRGRALSRAQRTSDRSIAARQQEQLIRELWSTNKTVPQIADDLGMTTANVKKMRQRLKLPPRPRGRRPSQ